MMKLERWATGFLVLACTYGPMVRAQQGQWTWLKGSSTINSSGNWGAMGVTSPNTTPPALFQTEFWTALDGSLWMYGGRNTDAQEFAALWKYDPATNTWTWMKGPNTPSFEGNFGTQGIASASNLPPAKSFCMTSWTDLDGNFWMYGGRNGSQFGDAVQNNDLWRYEPATNMWTWMKGSMADNPPAVWGTKGVPDMANQPPAMTLAQATWTDDNGDLWMFGGYSTLPFPNQGHYNAMWRYNIPSNTWTWMNGDTLVNQPADFGALGVPAASNKPKGRYTQSLGKSSDGKFWIYGGTASGNFQYTDLWSFDPMTARWTWEGGSQTPQVNPTYSAVCADDPLNDIGSRKGLTWRDSEEQLWLFGEATDGGTPRSRNDLWTYCAVTDRWDWVSGPNQLDDPGNWGTIGVADPMNRPNGRLFGASWTGADGALYLYGGLEAGFFFPVRNDLWKYVPDPGCAPCSGTTTLNEVSADKAIPLELLDGRLQLPSGTWTLRVADMVGRTLFTQGGASGSVSMPTTVLNASGLVVFTATNSNGRVVSRKAALVAP